jgi:hypothetical protein
VLAPRGEFILRGKVYYIFKNVGWYFWMGIIGGGLCAMCHSYMVLGDTYGMSQYYGVDTYGIGDTYGMSRHSVVWGILMVW